MNTQKLWLLREVDQEKVAFIQNNFGYSSLISTLLVGRGIDSKESIESFFNFSFKNLKDPKVLAGIDEGINRVQQAIFNNEVIGIFGDYDVDGVCSASLMYQFLTLLKPGLKVYFTLPNRLTEGYGLSKAGILRLHQVHAKLIITTDCGSTSDKEIEYAKNLGIDVIVIDHHKISEKLPDCVAIINPQRKDCASGLSYLCASGVAFYFCMALRRSLRENGFFLENTEPDLIQLLDLVALATVADVVPLINENRNFLKYGLNIIKEGKRVGLKALIDVALLDKNKISSTNLGFHLAPRINAAGRLDDALIALQLMISDNEKEAFKLAQSLENSNQERRALEQGVLEEVLQKINEENLAKDPILVVHDEAWHIGVVGIVASRVAEIFHRPAIIIGHQQKGSGRSIPGIDLYNEVKKVAHNLLGFGGHAHAIGLTLLGPEVFSFREELIKVMTESLDKDVFDKKIFYDALLTFKDINSHLINELIKFEPSGSKNPHPIFRIDRSFIRNLRRLNGGHIRGELENEYGSLAFIAFRTDIKDELVNSPIDVLAIIEKNIWRDRESLQLRIIDYKKSP